MPQGVDTLTALVIINASTNGGYPETQLKFGMKATMSEDLTTLLAQRAELESKITAIQIEGKKEAVKKARDFVAKHGLTAADVFPSASASPAKRQIAKPAVKYRDPATGESWSGRGFMASWLRNKIAAGAKKEDFLVESL